MGPNAQAVMPGANGRMDAATLSPRRNHRAAAISIPLPLAGRGQGWGCRKRGVDDADNAFDVLQNIIVPEAENLKLITGQTEVTLPVNRCVCIFIVLTAVDFDHKTGSVTGKIDDHSVNWNLTAKMQSALFVVAQ
jgi:hypothetical protein